MRGQNIWFLWRNKEVIPVTPYLYSALLYLPRGVTAASVSCFRGVDMSMKSSAT